MVENFTNFTSIELEVGVSEMTETDNSYEDQQVWVVSLTLWFKRIVTDLITIWQIVNVVFFMPLVTVRVTSENMVVTKNKIKSLKVFTDSMANRCDVCMDYQGNRLHFGMVRGY